MAKYETEQARKVAQGIGKVRSTKDLAELIRTARTRQDNLYRKERIQRNMDAFEEHQERGKGSLVMLSPSYACYGRNDIKHGVAYAIHGFHFGRKHIGMWLQYQDKKPVWVACTRAADFVPYDPTVAQRQRSKNETSQRLSGILSDVTR